MSVKKQMNSKKMKVLIEVDAITHSCMKDSAAKSGCTVAAFYVFAAIVGRDECEKFLVKQNDDMLSKLIKKLD